MAYFLAVSYSSVYLRRSEQRLLQLFNTLNRRTSELEKSQAQLQAIYENSRALASILDPGPAREAVRYLGIQSHLQNLMEGAVHSVDLVYFVLVVVLFISMTRTSVESLRWR